MQAILSRWGTPAAHMHGEAISETLNPSHAGRIVSDAGRISLLFAINT